MTEFPSWGVAVVTGVISFAATYGAIRAQVAGIMRQLAEVAAEVKEVRHIMTRIEVVDARLAVVEREVGTLRDAQHVTSREVADLRAAWSHSSAR